MAIKIPQLSYDFMRDVVAHVGFYIVFIVEYSMLPGQIPTCNRKNTRLSFGVECYPHE
jgi:hypothetical protein